MLHGRRYFLYSLFFLSSLFSVIGCASTAPLPSALNIEKPSSDVPPEIASFSGVWTGRWYESFGACVECKLRIATILVVEKINSETAEVIISNGHIPGYGTGGYVHASASVLPGPAIEWADPEGNIYKYIMNKRSDSITGLIKLKYYDAVLQAIMSRKKTDRDQ